MYGKSFLFSYFKSRLLYLRYYSKNKDLLDVLVNMSKNKSPSNDWYETKMKTKLSCAPSHVYLQVIGSGARGAPSSLYLFTDHNRYLFNCGEATQRLALEHKVKIAKLDHIFITNKTWRNLGGLPGLSITLQQVGLREITVHGPMGIDILYEATKGFAVMKDMYININKCSHKEEFEDSALNVKYILLHPEDKVKVKLGSPNKKAKLDTHQKYFDDIVYDNTDYYNSKPQEKKRKSPTLKANKPTLGPAYMLQREVNDSHATVAFVVSLKKRLGTLCLEKCVELGVKPGPLLGKLKNGEDVTLPDGKVVRSADVKTPDDPGPVFIVLEVPDLSYLKDSDFCDYYESTHVKSNIPVLVVHFTPANVVSTSQYKTFMSKFGPKTNHLLINELNSCLGSEAVHRMQYKLNLLDNKIFPLLKDVSLPYEWNDGDPTPSGQMEKHLEEIQNMIAVAQFQSIVNTEMRFSAERKAMALLGEHKLNIINTRSLTKFHLRPTRCVDRTLEPKLTVKTYIQEVYNMEGFHESFKKMKSNVLKTRNERLENAPKYPKVTFFGTGSSMPGKTRNVSSIAIHTEETSSILLDCGEGTLSQLWRFYGLKQTNEFLRNLRAIYISHLHADHHIGLIGILQARRRAYEDIYKPVTPLYLIAPGQIISWLAIYDKYFESILDDFQLIPNQDLLSDNPDISAANLVYMGLEKINTCLVSHCPNAFGVALYINGGYKFTYSGDTIPCQELVELGKDSNVLIHEATIEDVLEMDARLKMHSTTTQAINTGAKMNAQHTILTHFSQRYARIPILENIEDSRYSNVGIAFDYMEVSLEDMDLLSHFHVPLQLMFADYTDELELKSANRKKNLEKQLASSSSDLDVVTSVPSIVQGTDEQEDSNMLIIVENEKKGKKAAVIGSNAKCQSMQYKKTMIRRGIVMSIVENVLKMKCGPSVSDFHRSKTQIPGSKNIIHPSERRSHILVKSNKVLKPAKSCPKKEDMKKTTTGICRTPIECMRIHSKGRQFNPQLSNIINNVIEELGTPSETKSNTTFVKTPAKVRQNVKEVKQKFQSKEYLNSSKYEKIEGLNWISWK